VLESRVIFLAGKPQYLCPALGASEPSPTHTLASDEEEGGRGKGWHLPLRRRRRREGGGGRRNGRKRGRMRGKEGEGKE